MWRKGCQDRIAKSEELNVESALPHEEAMATDQLRRTLEVQDNTIDCYKAPMKAKTAEFKARPMKRRRTKGKSNGGSHWDKDAVQMVCELLVLGVPPTMIPGTIVMMYESLLESSLLGITLEKLEKVWFATDNCNATQKLAQLAEEELNMGKQSCWNHFQNTMGFHAR